MEGLEFGRLVGSASLGMLEVPRAGLWLRAGGRWVCLGFRPSGIHGVLVLGHPTAPTGGLDGTVSQSAPAPLAKGGMCPSPYSPEFDFLGLGLRMEHSLMCMCVLRVAP